MPTTRLRLQRDSGGKADDSMALYQVMSDSEAKPPPYRRRYGVTERGLQVLRKSRTRQLTYGSGAEPRHRGLGQHLYNSQSSIGSGQDGDELRLV
ncbi:hypothetical protein RJ640_029021 [Escallonia rubra]|uniref:Uncharacterized protein n=1 Tax=Escallonia rubra TaxID=112253 RepID=A0AA88RSN1_9ASTE|nr:hypothetical protein RJ640_029021 [Escallonia rubra]